MAGVELESEEVDESLYSTKENEGKEGLRDWIDWEGGVYDAINGYGITIERAEETLGGPLPGRIKVAWKRIQDVEEAAREIMTWLEEE